MIGRRQNLAAKFAVSGRLEPADAPHRVIIVAFRKGAQRPGGRPRLPGRINKRRQYFRHRLLELKLGNERLPQFL